jgi:membrane fusion protein (multidrug efflux system)
LIEIDAYPGEEWTATVTAIASATGAEFAMLPPQNATGNWVKVVQRVPVLFDISGSRETPVLRAGMTATVSIDTGHQRTLSDLLPR